MEYFDLIRQRHSVRAYKPDLVEEEKLNKILEAARLAPTACNLQAFKIIVIHTAGRQQEISRIYGKEWFYKAPVVLGICAIPNKAWSRSDGKNYCDIDAAIVMDHVILAATDLGLGTCWIGAFNPTAAKEVLKLGPDMEPVAFTPIGYPETREFKKVRKNLDELVIRID
ncbi:MAG: nitroreductase family protein [Tepidanaerobacteraceae bacterium]|jgi:nitroreductase|nr:nitroreductase family protein [Tepidanaerobacteraceae bacterium]